MSAEFHSPLLLRYNSRECFQSALREVVKYPSTVGFEPGTLALIANTLINFAERTGSKASTDHVSLPVTLTSCVLLVECLQEALCHAIVLWMI